MRRYKIFFSKKLAKEHKALSKGERQKIDEAIASLEEDPKPIGQYKKIKGGRSDNAFRIRQGDYRVGYRMDEEKKIKNFINKKTSNYLPMCLHAVFSKTTCCDSFFKFAT